MYYYYCNCNPNAWVNQGYSNSNPYGFFPPYRPMVNPYQGPIPPRGSIRQDEESGFASLSPLAEKIMDKGCIPLEEIGLPGKVCIKVNTSGGAIQSITITIDIAGFYVTGEVDEQNGWQAQLDTGYEVAGVGVSLGFLYNIKSGCLSMCVDLSYMVGNVSPWFWVIGCTKPALNP